MPVTCIGITEVSGDGRNIATIILNVRESDVQQLK